MEGGPGGPEVAGARPAGQAIGPDHGVGGASEGAVPGGPKERGEKGGVVDLSRIKI